FNRIVSCNNCLRMGKKCEWSRVMCKSDFNKRQETVKHLTFYSAGFERGNITRKLHLQGYVQFDTRVTGKFVKAHLGQNLHIDIPKFDPPMKKNSNRAQKSGAECRFEYSVKRYERCTNHMRCSCSYIDLEDVCDECLPTREKCNEGRNVLDVFDKNGIVLEKYIFGDLNRKIGIRKPRKRKRADEYDTISVSTENSDLFSENEERNQSKKPKHDSKTNENEKKVENYKKMLSMLKSGETAFTILSKKPDLFMKASQLRALEPGAQHENLKSKIMVTTSKWKPEDFLIPRVINDWILENIFKTHANRRNQVLVLKNGTGKWSLIESLTNHGIKIAHFRNEFQPYLYDSKAYDILCLDHVHDFMVPNKGNEKVLNHRKYAQLLLGKDRILVNGKSFIEKSIPIIILCDDNTCPFMYSGSTEDENFRKKFFRNSLVINLKSLDLRNNKIINTCSIFRNNIHQEIQIMGQEHDNSLGINLTIDHFRFDYFNHKIPKGNHNNETPNTEDYGVGPSRTRRHSTISESDSQTVHSENFSEGS